MLPGDQTMPEYYKLLPDRYRDNLIKKRENFVRDNKGAAEIDRLDYFVYKIVSATPQFDLPNLAKVQPGAGGNGDIMSMIKANPMIAGGAVLGILFLFMRRKRA